MLLLAGLLPGLLYAQDYQVTGRVIDKETRQPIPGVNVVIAGTVKGTVTDAKGNFVLANIADGEYTLSISYIGYRQVARKVTVPESNTDLAINLENDVVGLDAVVVTGQGIDIAKRRLSTNVTTVTREQIERSPATRLDQLLQAQLPNAQIRMNTSQPGSASIIRSRGIVSAAVSSTPVIYVDGVRIDNLNTASTLSLNTSGNRHNGDASSTISDIPLENIERIEYLSGGAATTLYGSDAANGVIQIFTKRGGSGTGNVSFQTILGAETPTTDFYHFDRTADLLYQDAFYQQYRLSMDGGTSDFGYSFSGSMLHTDGTRIHDQNFNTRYDLRTSLTARVGKIGRYVSSFGFTNNRFGRVRNGNAGGYTGMWFAEAGQSVGFGFNNNLDALEEEEYNRMKEFVSLAEKLQNYRIGVNRFQTSQALELTPIQNLRVRGTVGLDFRSSSEQGIESNQYLIHTRVVPAGTENRGSIARYERRFLGLTMELTGQHSLNVGNFSFISTLGTQLFRNQDNQAELTGSDLREGSQRITDASTRGSRDFLLTVVNYGVYGQENIGFKNRYFLEFGLRADGNSAFGENIGWQTYPKVGATWVLSDEPFLQGLSEVISSVKLRANYGVAGNFPPPFANERTVAFSPFLGASTARFGQYGNPDLKPEKTYTWEAGTDLGLFNDHLTVGFTFYHGTTRDALLYVPLPPSYGEAVQLQNAGKYLNRGIELATSLTILRNQNCTLRLNTAINTLYNRVLSTGGTPPFAINGFSARTVQSIVAEGQEMGVIRGSAATFGEDGSIVAVDPVAIIAHPLPNLFGNIGLNFSFRNRLNFFATADYQTGAENHSFDRQFRFQYGLPDPDVPAKAIADAGGRQSAIWLDVTNLFVEKTDYLKVRLIGLDYSLPKKWFGRFVKDVQVGLSATNPFNFVTSSFDPEVDHSGARDPDPNSLTGTAQNGASVGGFNYSTSSPNRQFLGNIRIRL